MLRKCVDNITDYCYTSIKDMTLLCGHGGYNIGEEVLGGIYEIQE